MKTKIKYIANAIIWFDKKNGNSYNSVRITRVDSGNTIYASIEYGYGDQYRQHALEAMERAQWLPKKYKGANRWNYERENNYPIYWQSAPGTKTECIANGKI